MSSAPAQTRPLSVWQILFCGGMIVTFSMGVRHGFGLWLQPIIQANDWGRETFSFAIAIQNLMWGITGVFAGMLADRFGAFKVIIAGAILYALGLLGMAYTTSPLTFTLTTGVLLGMAQAGTTYAVIFGVIGRNIPVSRRSWAMGVAAAAGSFGQFLMLPTENILINSFGWQQALVVLSVAVLTIVPLAFGLREKTMHLATEEQSQATHTASQQGIVHAIREAFAYRSFRLLVLGYFVCGFQVVFIGVHMPSYLKDEGLSAEVASYALALIGLFNIFGTYLVGSLGQVWPKRYLLAFIYSARGVAIVLFLIAPISATSVYIFSAVMGFLWLSTVPPTNAIVAQIFGVRHFSMLGGFVFFSHQIGSFLGVWLGGKLYDIYGNYDVVWYLAIVLSVFATLMNLPINENAIDRKQAVAA
ncbi:MFS transporter [Advenella mimigardefordensis]|uniref:Putative transport protein, MFS-type n=1 Tax=Advenella mimigardefordensis (strain DSM 17166 / LMG 22922 / DPN7) TaxID=1247726 RepID=W0PA59_ADVMD|nr:MFS transporter [Advenella mimigardefordensis]AHG62290.1 putative transport protein, MFS-type [Advenella mimigardefordensis DPN7]